MVMVEIPNASKIMYDMIVKEEKTEDRRNKILTELEKLFSGLPPTLDTKSREVFNGKFTALKSFLFDLNQST